ncbi:TIGR03862 family flavoprotein [Beijerinckia sp. L45]|uniref:NAD(P)/FAD-dependent oxidoreductase n=1 Tax=Beijerinckia sp. L45 TaxID=1641855 RepID=UPI001FED392E|nr:TIGR03862 family flavoprotein [Beijerinckia sp. L45]
MAVIGAGPAGLMAAEVAATGGARVTIYDRMPSVGRKFLLAGRGGLNITHSEPLVPFLARYAEAEPHLRPSIEGWTPDAVRAWCEALGQPTFVGSSGRVFPSAFKTSPLLRAWLRRLESLGVSFAMRHRWTGWDADGRLTLDAPDGPVTVEASATILALGGASWPQLGSDGGWVETLRGDGSDVSALRPANCGFAVAWSDLFRDKFEGQPLKGIGLRFAGHSIRGEAMVTRAGIEGGGIYALSAPLREALARDGKATLHIALLPDQSQEAIVARLQTRQPKQSVSNALRKALHLAPVAIALLHEAAQGAPTPLAAMEPADLAALVNAVPVRLTKTMPIAKAISTAGGVLFAGVDDQLMLRQRPGTFVAGEMLDWEAPTGGYLLQACFATGAAAGRGALRWLQPNSSI